MCPLTRVLGAHLKRACVACMPTTHPDYSLLGFRALPPNPPSKEGLRVVWDALIHLNLKLCVTSVRRGTAARI